MAKPVANLIKQNYLHSNRWLFYQNLAYNGLPINTKNDTRRIELQQAKINLESILDNVKQRETAFYNDFGVKDNKEWSQKYLIGKNRGEGSKVGKLTYIFHSRELYNILSNTDSNRRKELAKIYSSIIEEAAGDKITKYCLKKVKNVMPSSLGDVFKTIDVLNKTYKARDIQHAIIQALSKYMDEIPELPKGAIIKPNSDKLKQIENLIKTEPQKDLRLQKSLNLIEIEMKKTNLFSPKEIENVLTMWREIFIKDALGKDKRLTSFEITKVEGKVQEVSKIITNSEIFWNFTITEDLGEDYKIGNFKTLVKVQGDELVKRFKQENGKFNEAESKTDTVWIGPKTKQTYYIQEKNSISEAYKDFDMTGDPEQISKKIPSPIKIQSDVKLKNLIDYFKQARIYPDEDIYDFITYCLINFEALNKWSADEKEDDNANNRIGDKKLYKKNSHSNEKKFVASALTQQTIEQFLAGGLQIFISDIVYKDTPSENPIIFKSYDFINFRDYYLIPVSKIIEQLIAYITMLDDSLFRLRFTSSLPNFNDSDMRSIYNEKLKILSNDTDSTADYHNEQLVQYGSRQGKTVADALKISGIRLNFSTKALHNMVYK